MTALANRYDFVLLFDVMDGNPNGDPDAGNWPRFDTETGQGLVTDVCIKRKVRNYVQLSQTAPGLDIYVKSQSILGDAQMRAYTALGLKVPDAEAEADPADPGAAEVDAESEPEAEQVKAKGKGKGKGKKGKKDAEETAKDRAKSAAAAQDMLSAQDWMCRNYYDVRTFGAVMVGKPNCGKVCGPVQITFARSVDPVVVTEHCITRMAVTDQEDADKKAPGHLQTMGTKATVHYGLYRAHGFVSPALAKKTGFTAEDLKLLWQSLAAMFEHDRSASRGLMTMCRLVVFKHASELGNAPAHKLFDLVQVKRKSLDRPPRSFSDYEFTIGTTPPGVTAEQYESAI